MSVTLRRYRPADAVEVGRLIAETFREFNLRGASLEEQEKFLGPFRHAASEVAEHRASIAKVIDAPLVWIAVDRRDRRIVGVLRGSPGRLHSLFVRASHHRRGIGRRLIARLEHETVKAGQNKITMQATLYAVPFYQRLGYVRSTGVRSGRCFDGTGFEYQPMKKIL